MMIRIRSRDGLERVSVENLSATVGQLKLEIEQQLGVPVHAQVLSTNKRLLLAKNPDEFNEFTDMGDAYTGLCSLKVSHGSIVYLAYEGERTVAGPAFQPSGSFGKKMTIGDMISKQMRITPQENPHCELVSFDIDAANAFQLYVNQSIGFTFKRGGFMYGTVSELGKVEVNFIYEPPQRGTEENVWLLRDPDEEKYVEAIAFGLGMKKVGYIFNEGISEHSNDYTMSNSDILQAVELQGEGDLKQWITTMVKLNVNEDGERSVCFEAFQLSDICLKLFKEGWFEQDTVNKVNDPKLSRMNKDVVVAGKYTRDVDNDFFLVPVKISQHQGPLSSSFPIENRDDCPVTMKTLKTHLDRTKGLPFVKRISDFHLLLRLSEHLDINIDVPALTGCVMSQGAVREGYQLLIESLACS